MNDLTELYKKQEYQDSIGSTVNDLPTLSQINNAKNMKRSNENQNNNSKNNLKKNVPIESVKECAPLPLNKADSKSIKNVKPIKEDYEASIKKKDSSQIHLNIYNNSQNMRNIKKVYVNNSTFNTPESQNNYGGENPYNDY